MSGADTQKIFRVASVQKPFSMLGNGMLQDERLTIEARGFLASIMSRGPNWIFHISWAQKAHGIGRDKAYRIINELVKEGYCIRTRQIARSGQVVSWEYHFTDCPELYHEQSEAQQRVSPDPENQEVVESVTFVPVPEKPDPAQPDPENQDAYKGKTLRKNRKEENTDTTARDALPDGGRKDQPEAKAKLNGRNPAQGRLLESVSPTSTARACFEQFRSVAQEVGFIEPKIMTASREAGIRQILQTYGEASWAQALANARNSVFLKGNNGAGWVMSLDDMLKEKIYVRLLEGGFVGKPTLVVGDGSSYSKNGTYTGRTL